MEKIERPKVKGKNFWGPPIWTTIHILAATLSPETAQYYKTFLECLTHLLPCEQCKRNLAEKLRNHPPDAYLSNNHDAFFYTYMLHDLANEHISAEHIENGHSELQKESPNYDEIKAFYFSGLSQECKGCGI